MSAIFGKFCFDGRPVPSSELLTMQQAMAYWGPDGDGIWCEDHIGLGNLRFNNTPESVGDTQPWVCPVSGDVITASVRLDNRDELLNTLSIQVPDGATVPDSHIILSAYHRWGEACANRLLGDWVFAIWNRKERKLFIARDHHGNTGLYYYTDSRCLIFAPSLKGLLALPEVPRRPNPQAIAEVLVAWPAHGASTCYEGVLRLPPAHAMTVTPKGIKVERYWYLEHTPNLRLGTDNDYVEAFLEIYTEAVRCRLRSPAPVGISLSGGLDSGSVAALAARELGKNGRRLAAFSSVPISPSEDLVDGHLADETPLIEATTEFIGNIDLQYIKARDASPVAGIKRALDIHGQPTHGGGNMYWIATLMAEAQSQGLGALLTGQGGNSTISWAGGPKTPLLHYLLTAQWKTFGRKLQAWQEATGRSTWEAVKGQVVRPMAAPLSPLRQNWLRQRAAPDPWRNYSAINAALARDLDLNQKMLEGGHDATYRLKRDPVQARLAHIRPGRAAVGHLWSELGATYGLEVRDPTLDSRIMSFCWSIPRSQYVQDDQDRLLIRRSMAGYLPERVRFNRRVGIQAADIAQRVVVHRDEMESALTSLEQSQLVHYYLDLPKMRGVFESLQHRIDSTGREQCGTILLRGLMVGLFLLQFD
jgi:asparagine synthase (glutamine-hydrolysing)